VRLCAWLGQAFAVERVSLLFKDRHRIELIRANLIEAEVNAEPHGELEINCPAKQLALFRCLRNIEPI
jgi:hypothetical protein